MFPKKCLKFESQGGVSLRKKPYNMYARKYFEKLTGQR